MRVLVRVGLRQAKLYASADLAEFVIVAVPRGLNRSFFLPPKAYASEIVKRTIQHNQPKALWLCRREGLL